MKKKSVDEAIDELIEFYQTVEIDDVNYIRKLFIRNLKDLKRRNAKEKLGDE